MRIPLYPNCSVCDRKQYVWVDLNAKDAEFKCKFCGDENSALLMTSITIGYRLLCRSVYELTENKDYSLSIVFSAAAIDCRLTQLHDKWQELKVLEAEIKAGSLVEEGVRRVDRITGRAYETKELEEMLRGYRTVVKKMKVVSELMYPLGFEQFVKDRPDLWRTIEDGFPTLQSNRLVASLVEELFRPRNAILHRGKSDFTEAQAVKCLNIAQVGLWILNEMDQSRRKEKAP